MYDLFCKQNTVIKVSCTFGVSPGQYVIVIIHYHENCDKKSSFVDKSHSQYYTGLRDLTYQAEYP